MPIEKHPPRQSKLLMSHEDKVRLRMKREGGKMTDEQSVNERERVKTNDFDLSFFLSSPFTNWFSSSPDQRRRRKNRFESSTSIVIKSVTEISIDLSSRFHLFFFSFFAQRLVRKEILFLSNKNQLRFSSLRAVSRSFSC